MWEMGINLPVSTQQSTTLRALIGDPTELDHPEIAMRVRSIDPDLWQHAGAVAAHVDAMCNLLPESNNVQRERFVDAAWLHDIGKLTMSREILLKPSPLSEAEWIDMRDHPSRGAEFVQCSNSLSSLAPLIRQHHEWFEGGGYPDRLSGNEIELCARLIGVADAYDAMTTWRAYRLKMADEDAIAELQRCAGTQFDPEIVELFIRATDDLRTKAVR